MSVPGDKLSLPFFDRLTTKLAIAMVVFLFALTMAVAFLVETGFRRNQYSAYTSSQSILEEQTRTALVQATTIQVELLDSHLLEASRLVDHTAAFLEAYVEQTIPVRLDRAAVGPLFDKLLSQNSDLSALYFTSMQGEVIQSTNPAGPSPGSNLLLAAADSTSDWQIAGSLNEQAVIVSAPVYQGEQMLGVVRAVLPGEHLSDHLHELVGLEGSYAFILTSDGKMLLSTAETIPANILQAASAVTTQMAGSAAVELDGNRGLLVTAPLLEPGWLVGIAAPLVEIEESSSSVANAVWQTAEGTIRATLLQMFVVFSIGLVITLVIVSRMFNRRMSLMMNQVHAITKGDYSVSVPVDAPDEFGLLARSFNQMSGEIQRRRAELVQSNTDLQRSEDEYRQLAQSLENRVQESTREIQTLYEQTSTRSRELEALYQADEELYRHLRLDQVLQALVDVAVDQLKADKCGVHVWDESEQRLTVRAARGFSTAAIERINHYTAGDGVFGRVFDTGEIITVEDAALAPPPANEIAAAEGIRSIISVPIKINEQIFGVFGMNYCQPRRFTDSDVRLFQALAQRAAIAVQNAHLYEQAEQAATLEERQRLARELHDAITQSLYSLVLLAEAGRRHLTAGNQAQVEHHLARLGETAQQALKEMRLLVYELRPPALTSAGLAGAIRHRLNAVEKRAGIQVRLIEEGTLALPASVEEQIFRLVQEALNNAIKHSGARSILVSLRQKPGLFEAEIQDDGRGFDQQEPPSGGVGLNSMRERAERIQAALIVESTIGEGTLVRVRCPLPTT
jgi:nitrate/nitrite-specific signal transduction histidine kinase